MTARRLRAVGARADLEHVVGLADAELLEEHVGHRAVVVLAGVHEHVLELVRRGARARARSARSS